MELVKVQNAGQRKEFIRLAHDLYKNDPNWIAPLDNDIEGVFDPKKNTAFSNGEACRWILLDDTKKAIGRVAAFINHKALATMEYPAGSMGFFDCINDQKAAFLLFDTAKQWLEERGMKAMEGPVNFGERDRFWGLLVKGFEPPSYMEAYNPPYYQQFFDEYGFKLYFRQDTYLLQKDSFSPDRVERISQRVEAKPEHTFEHINPRELRKYAGDFVYIYNAAWQKFENFKPVTVNEILAVFKSMAPVIDKEFIKFAYVNGEPAGFLVALPDVNQIFKHLHGKMDLLAKLKFLYYRYTTKINKLKGLVFGIHPKFHNVGLDAVLVYKTYLSMSKDWQYQSISINWVGGFNPKMQKFMNALSGQLEKVHYTYRYMIDESIPFKPYELGEYDKEGKEEAS